MAILSDGPPVLLNVARRRPSPTPQAAITWSAGVTTALKTDFKLKNLIGKGSGESIQMALLGPGLGARAAVRGPDLGGADHGGGSGGPLGNLLGG